MKLIQYLREACDTFSENAPSSIMYYFNGEKTGIEFEDFEISDSSIKIEDDLIIPLDIEGKFNDDDVFEFVLDGDKLGLEFWF